ncbi:MAG TPA: proline dehydrogenase family protein, partial [Polyangiaceae bacterium]|nr:proline dehydrogenase family protein [Polyangiaceae bacterium]
MKFQSGGDHRAQNARDLIESVRGRPLSQDDLKTKASELATLLLDLARDLQTPPEHRHSTQLLRLMDEPQGLAFGQALTDRVARPRSARKRVQAAQRLLAARGIPQSLPVFDRLSLMLLRSAGHIAPGLAAAGILRRIRQEIDPYLIAASPAQVGERLMQLQQGGLRVNVNRLGEEVLSEADAREHCAAYLALLAQPEVSTVSVKISAICSHINVLSWNETLALLKGALRPLYHAAAQATPPKLVYLDMESYRDLELNIALFQSLLSEPDLLGLTAGVVLQA